MAEYDINLSSLSSKQSDVEDLKINAEDIYNEFNNYSNSGAFSNSELSGIKSNITNLTTRLKNGHTNSFHWYKNYLTELTDLENNLASFEAANLTAPTEFKGEFVDMFGKVTMPVLKTGGDIHALATSFSSSGSTQASEFYELGDRAYNGDKEAQQEWIEKVAKLVQDSQYSKYGLKNSLIIAQIINESGWMHTPTTTNSDGSTLSGNNNVLGINYDMGVSIDKQDSTWAQNAKSTDSNVTQWNSDGTAVVGTVESMRTYDSVEDCIEDYANVLYLYHPECKGSNNLEDYRSFLEGYTPNPNGSTTDKYANIISMYNLEQYDQ